MKKVTAEEHTTTIRQKAKAHQDKYPTFNVEIFMDWIETKLHKKTYAEMTTAEANQRRKREERFHRYMEKD